MARIERSLTRWRICLCVVEATLLTLSPFVSNGGPWEATAYVITSSNVLPVHRQRKYLQELTSDLVQATPGKLTEQQIAVSRELIYAWSHSAPMNQEKKECALQVESLVRRVIDERLAGNRCAELDTNDYNCLLEGWARSGLGEASALRTEQILETMEEQGVPAPNLSSFKACLMAWRHANVSYAAARAHRILEWMIRLYAQEENPNALPDADCFDIVLQLWSRSGHDQAPQQTERLLGVMERLHRETGIAKLKPRQSSYNAVLAAWSKSGSVSAAERVIKIVSFMESMGVNDPFVAPDSISYNIVMGTLAKSADSVTSANQADTLVRHVTAVYKQRLGTVTEFKPEILLFNIAIGLWAKTGTVGSYRKARSLLDRQISLSQEFGTVAPDIVGWTSVLNSCATETGHAEERNKAFKVATLTYRQLQKLDVSANHVTYGTMLKACARLQHVRSPLRLKWTRAVFADAVAAGAVGDMVVSKLREAAPSDLYKELMQGHSRNKLPAEWTINVQEHSPFRSKITSGKRAEV